VSEYGVVYEEQFRLNLRRYASVRDQIQRRAKRVLADPYASTEYLDDASGKLDLRGCRSARVNRNFRIIFVICKECRHVPECQYCFCEGLPDETVVFLTVGPHDRAYALKESETGWTYA
jgi:mRNA-degrading endonuclease RelE of RelBE toxin-antitoxin system